MTARQPGLTFPLVVATLDEIRHQLNGRPTPTPCDCDWSDPAPSVAQWPPTTILMGVRHGEECEAENAAGELDVLWVITVPGTELETMDGGRW